MKLEKWTGLLKKYRYAALIVLAGMVLMLLPTGGSDFHGANHGHPNPVGACITSDDQIARIEELAHQRKQR